MVKRRVEDNCKIKKTKVASCKQWSNGALRIIERLKQQMFLPINNGQMAGSG